MRILNIFTLLILTALSALLLSSSAIPPASGRTLHAVPVDPESVTATFANIGGNVFQPDQVVTVKWSLAGDGVKALEQNPWSECELLLSLDGGATWSRISPQLSVTRRTFDWFVPKVSTRQALIQLRIGIEGSGDMFSFPSTPFSISAPWDSLK